MVRFSRVAPPQPVRSLPLIIGHRGASALETENTRRRVRARPRRRRRRRRAGRDDVRHRRGGRVPRRRSGAAGAASRAHRRHAVGGAARGDAAAGARIPTLEEAFEACGPELLVNVELKVPSRAPSAFAPLVDRVAAIVERAGAGARVLVSSFNPWRCGCGCGARRPSPAGLLFEREAPLPLRRAWAAPLLRPFALHPEIVLVHGRSACRALAAPRLHGQRLDRRRRGGARGLPRHGRRRRHHQRSRAGPRAGCDRRAGCATGQAV